MKDRLFLCLDGLFGTGPGKDMGERLAKEVVGCVDGLCIQVVEIAFLINIYGAGVFGNDGVDHACVSTHFQREGAEGLLVACVEDDLVYLLLDCGWTVGRRDEHGEQWLQRLGVMKECAAGDGGQICFCVRIPNTVEQSSVLDVWTKALGLFIIAHHKHQIELVGKLIKNVIMQCFRLADQKKGAVGMMRSECACWLGVTIDEEYPGIDPQSFAVIDDGVEGLL